MADLWVWKDRASRREKWDRVRTLAHQFSEPVVRLLEVPGAFIPGAPAALEKLGALFGADLNISPLDSEEVLMPLDGAPGPFASADGSEPVFIEGVLMAVSVAHDANGAEPILLERVDLQVIDFTPGPAQTYEEQIAGAALFGAGFVQPLRFFVELDGKTVGRARRSVRGTDGKSNMVVADSPNFLDADPAAFLTLSPSEQAMFRFTVTANTCGLYRVCLRWFYRVAARELRQHTSLSVSIYKGNE
jgi:hypothetical protein